MDRDQVIPEAFYDSLSLAHKLDDVLDGFRLEEIHLFSYFSSILFLYKKLPLADWRYRFTVDQNGYPYSMQLGNGINRHELNGLFDKQGEFYRVTSRGAAELGKFKKLDTLFKREIFLEAACTTTIMIPYSQTLRALLRDPIISKNRELQTDRWLDQEDAYMKFKEISQAVGIETDDLIISAVTWINYITEKEKAAEAGRHTNA